MEKRLLTIRKILELGGLDTNKRIKLVRHKDDREHKTINGLTEDGNPADWYINDRQKFLAYQSEMRHDIFKDIDYVVSFIGEEGNAARLIGIYEVKGYDNERKRRIRGDKFYYDMVEVGGFDEFNERVIIDWGKGRTFHQELKANDKDVIAIEKDGLNVWTAYEEIKLSYEGLKRIIDSNISKWRDKLSACNCIYVISDNKSGKLYIGSTYNKEGIWGRWKDYAQTGHGGNVELKKLMDEDPNYAKDNFTWAILQTLPLDIKDEEAIKIETLWKNKLGREACALNGN